jgi:protein-arginine kinase activator protein McsA
MMMELIDAMKLNKTSKRRLKKILNDEFNGNADAMLADIERSVVQIEDYEAAAVVRDFRNKIK